MNPIAMHLASGMSLFTGAALVGLVVALAPWCRGGWGARLRSAGAGLGLALILGAATPHPAWLDALFIALFVAWFLAEELPRVRRAIRLLPPRVALAAVVFAMASLEFPHALPPSLPAGPAQPLYVIGDSISAGIGAAYPPWPDLMAAKYRLPVVNLAQAGATTADAIFQVSRVTAPDALVFVEIGGNDLLNGLPTSHFARDLEAFLAKLSRPGRTIVMLELPLLPLSGGYGQAQRTLARDYGVHLVPKRYFADVLGARGATDDGLHLSEAGAQRMADTLYPILAPALGRTP